MSAFRLVRAATLVDRPWKNGGGVTWEIAAWPAGAGYEAFDWRLSMAEVASTGPFSTFSGVDRTLVLVQGAALDLDLPDCSVRLDGIGAMVSFAGDQPAAGRLRAGPIRDFNVMTRRTAWTQTVRRIGAGAFPADRFSLILAHAAPLVAEVAGELIQLDRFDSLLIESPCRVAVSGDAILAIIEPQRAASGITQPPAPHPASPSA